MRDYRYTTPHGVLVTRTVTNVSTDDAGIYDVSVSAPAGTTVVVTHHVPHPASIAPRFTDHPLNPAFVSNLEDLMGHARLWIHGHTHHAFDYTVRGTRVLSNPRGYAGEETGFRADLVVEI